MPVHDWGRVPAGIFHAFHHEWIADISRSLNGGLLPPPYYALPEQMAGRFGPDVLALEQRIEEDFEPAASAQPDDGSVALLDAPPTVRQTAEAEADFYRRKQKQIAIRHVSGHKLVAMIEIISPGNKASRGDLRDFVEKAADLLDRKIHLLVIDVQPRTPRDPNGIHGAIWKEYAGEKHRAPVEEPLTLVSYEAAMVVRAYIEPFCAGSMLTPMPLYLEPRGYVLVPLEETYTTAFAAMPRYWRELLEKKG
jgi:hypothetical protein